MQKNFIFSLILFLACGFQSQTFGQYNSRGLKEIRKQMLYIPGGSFVMGNGYQYRNTSWWMEYLGEDSSFSKQNRNAIAIGEVPRFNNVERRVTVSSFYLSSAEVTNAEFKEFMVHATLGDEGSAEFWEELEIEEKKEEGNPKHLWLELAKKAARKGYLPDTACWDKDFQYSYVDPLSQNYYWHPAFDNYPVVGVTWKQANAYCDWLSDQFNSDEKMVKKYGRANFRLPTEAEWEYAALGQINPAGEEINTQKLYPWEGTRIWDEKGKYRANMKADHGDYFDDQYSFTAPVRKFPPNDFGLYDMAGNVSEWVQDVYRISRIEPVETLTPGNLTYQEASSESFRVTKGGSWADYRYAAIAGSRCQTEASRGHSRVGFRVAMMHYRQNQDGNHSN